MLTSRRQEWILQLIKGADIAPVENSPGCYQSKSAINVTAQNTRWAILPADSLDLSNAECLIMHIRGREFMIPWDQITALEFEEDLAAIPATPRSPRRLSVLRLLHFPLEKKR